MTNRFSSLPPAQFDPAEFPRKVNLGSGTDPRQDYLNIDMNAWNRPDLLADVRELGFLPSSYYDEILAQDVLEHLPRAQTLQTLVHWNRLLKPGGTIVLRVPNVLGLAEFFKHPDWQHPSRQEQLMQHLFGTQAYNGDWHFTSFTPVLLEHYLRESGFELKNVEILQGWLFDASARKVRHIERPIARDYAELMQIGDDEEFVRACYREMLQRDPDPGGWDLYVRGLREGGLTRRITLDAFLSSPEFRGLQDARRSRDG